jgi:hypothetical protein
VEHYAHELISALEERLIFVFDRVAEPGLKLDRVSKDDYPRLRAILRGGRDG